MVTLSVAGEKADTSVDVAKLLPELVANRKDNDVFAFTASKGLDEYLRKGVKLAQDAFAPIERIDAEVRQDPETDDEWIVLRVVVRADRVNVSAARKKYTAEWVASVPVALRFLIRLSPDIL